MFLSSNQKERGRGLQGKRPRGECGLFNMFKEGVGVDGERGFLKFSVRVLNDGRKRHVVALRHKETEIAGLKHTLKV